jgi:hypothetical protein
LRSALDERRAGSTCWNRGVTNQAEDVQARNRQLLDAVRVRRDRFYDAILAVERAISKPAGDAPDTWASSLAVPVANLRNMLDEHVSDTEGDDGLFEQMREDAPHLLPALERLRDEHEPLLEGTQTLADALGNVSGDDDVDLVRVHALDLLRRLLEHRHRGAELLYDAYAIDVSPAD